MKSHPIRIIQKFSALIIFSMLLFGSCHQKSGNSIKDEVSIIDSVKILIDSSKLSTLATEQKRSMLLLAIEINRQSHLDSVKNKNLLSIAYELYKLKDSLLFLDINGQAHELSIKLKDSFGIADTHWNFANFYSNYEENEKSFYHYKQAYYYFELIDHDYYVGKMLYNMAFVQSRIKDYTGSEISIFKAIPKFKKLKKSINLYKCYAFLGVVYMELEEYDKSLQYFATAIEYLSDIDQNSYNEESVLNNMGLVYSKSKNYEKAIESFDKALLNKTLQENKVRLYSRLIDNLAYVKFLKRDTSNVFKELNKSLIIRDSVGDKSGATMSKIHMAEFLAFRGDTSQAITFVKEASETALLINNNRDLLDSYQMLAEIDKKNASSYLKSYIRLNDSLKTQERKLRNKFTRVRFETDQYKEEAEKLSLQKIFILGAAGLIILILSFLYFIKIQRTKNKELLLEKEQQLANEEIYALMLKQQSKIEEGQLKERKRISQDLHDGILGNMFGTRVSLGFLDIDGDEETLQKHAVLIDELQKIEIEIRSISHDLKNEFFSNESNYIGILEDLVKAQSEIGNFSFKLSNDPSITWNKINNSIKINCYRILQEATQNIIKHSKASKVQVKFKKEEGKLIMTIKDNGIGFNLDKKKNGIGIKNMQSRMQKINGKLVLKSNEGSGTELTFYISL